MKRLMPANIVGQNVEPALVQSLILDRAILQVNTTSEDAKRWVLAIKLVLNANLLDRIWVSLEDLLHPRLPVTVARTDRLQINESRGVAIIFGLDADPVGCVSILLGQGTR